MTKPLRRGPQGWSSAASRRLRIADHGIECGLCGKFYKVIAWNHLTRIHDLDPLTAIPEYKRRYKLRTTRCADTQQRIRVSRRRRLAESGRLWTKEKVSRVLRQHARNGKLDPSSFPPKGYDAIYAVAARVFGSWPRALKESGLPLLKAPATKWTKAEVFRRMQQRRRKGLPLTMAEVKRTDSALYRMAQELTGRSWNAILQDLGLHGIRRHWTRPKLLAEIRYWQRHGRIRTVGLKYMTLRRIGRARFGTWTRAVTLAIGRPWSRYEEASWKYRSLR